MAVRSLKAPTFRAREPLQRGLDIVVAEEGVGGYVDGQLPTGAKSAGTITEISLAGAGFFVDFKVPANVARVAPPNFQGGEVAIRVEGVENGAGCLLFVPREAAEHRHRCLDASFESRRRCDEGNGRMAFRLGLAFGSIVLAACSTVGSAKPDGGPGSLADAGIHVGDAAHDDARSDASRDATGATPCSPRTCASLGLACGPAPDGCGGVVHCDDCPMFPPCGCAPATCAILGPFACGGQSDGCGGALNCGPCPPAAAPCSPLTCADYGDACGPQSDGCGGLTANCGDCSDGGQFCGAGGPSKCWPVMSKALTSKWCTALGSNCGFQHICGQMFVDCGTCPAPLYCGSNPQGPSGATTCGGVPLDAGSDACVPLTCAALGYQCGMAGDACGGTLDCGACTPPATCGAGGGYHLCGTQRAAGGPCLTCADFGDLHGCPFSDGCGNLLPSCGVGGGCSVVIWWPSRCGGGGVSFQCGSGGSCTPVTCAQLGYECGWNGDGCGGTVNCGTCPQGETCGGGGFNQCGPVPKDGGSD